MNKTTNISSTKNILDEQMDKMYDSITDDEKRELIEISEVGLQEGIDVALNRY